MPRPRGPKPIRSIPLSQRVAKSSKLVENAKEPQSHPLSQRAESLKNSDSADSSSNRHRRTYPGKENLIHPTSSINNLAEGSPAAVKNTVQKKPINPRHASKAPEVKQKPDREVVSHSPRNGDSPKPTTNSVPKRGSRTGNSQSEASSRRPSQAYKPQGTPLGHSSVLGALKFKKRARQPSLLQVAQSQQDTTTDLDDVDLSDLRPDDESTPLVKSSFQGQHLPSQSSSNSQRSRKRKLGDSGGDVLSTRSQQQSQSLLSDQALTPDDSFDLPPDDGESETSAPALPRFSMRRTLSSTQVHPTTSESQAPPRSSSVSAQSTLSLNRQRSDRTHAGENDLQSPISSPVPAKHLSTRKKSEAQPLPPPKPLTTARLQNLLPRRRTFLKQQDTFDIPSSSEIELDASRLAEDEDELSFHATAKMRKAKAPVEKNAKKRQGTKRKPPGGEHEPKRKRVSATYTKKTASDSYSADEEDDTLDTADTSVEVDAETGKVVPVLDTKTKTVMKRLAEKFKEIDDFDMEFEDVTGSSSQMHDAR